MSNYCNNVSVNVAQNKVEVHNPQVQVIRVVTAGPPGPPGDVVTQPATASYALTASYAENAGNTYTGSEGILVSGSVINLGGEITQNTIVEGETLQVTNLLISGSENYPSSSLDVYADNIEFDVDILELTGSLNVKGEINLDGEMDLGGFF